MTGRPPLIGLALALAATATAFAQPATPTVPKLKPPLEVPWVGYPWLPKDNPETGKPGLADDYRRLTERLNKWLAKPCLDPNTQRDMLAEVKSWIEYLLKYAKNSARTKEEGIEAQLNADTLLKKYEALQKKPPCPPTAGGTTTPGTNPGGGGGSTGGGTASGGAGTGGTQPSDGPQPCPDPEKIKAAKEKYSEAEKNLRDIETVLGDIQDQLNRLQKEQKLVNDYNQALKDNDKQALDEYQKNPEKMQAVNDARREIDGLKSQRQQLIEARGYWAKRMEEAAAELKRYGEDPPPWCEPPPDDGLMPVKPEKASAPVDSFPSVANAGVIFEPVALDGDAVDVSLSPPNLCCEPGMQKLGLTTDGAARVESTMAGAPPRLPLVREWIASLGRLVRGSALAAARSAWRPGGSSPELSAAELWLAPIGQADRSGGAPVTAVITSLGTSQGEAFRLQIVNDGPAPIRLSSDAIVVEPLKRAARSEAQRVLQRLAPRLQRATTLNVEGYCLDYALRPPDAGMLFRIAPPDVQARFAPARGVLRAAAALARTGGLTPDTNPKAYAESIKQYAVWTRLERWTQAQFADAWVNMTRKQMVGLKRQWTADMESTLREAVPGRWRDIQAILAGAGAP